MKKRGKKYNEVVKQYDKTQMYELDSGVDILKKLSYTKFDQTVEVAIRLKLKKSHTVRDTVVLPNFFGKEKKILVFAKGDLAKEAQESGATYVGDNDYIDKIKEGWLDVDVIIASPDMMKDVGKLGPILGRRGLMPNPKVGTVTTEMKKTIDELKKGRVEFRADKAGVVQLGIGKQSMDTNKLKENILTFYDEVLRKRPVDLKGEYVDSMYLSLTMSPSVQINTKTIK